MYQYWPESARWVSELLHEDHIVVNTEIQKDIENEGSADFRKISLCLQKATSRALCLNIMLLVSRLTKAELEKRCRIGSLMHYVYAGSLLHDDVMPIGCDAERILSTDIGGRNASAILLGDFLYSKAFQLMTRTDNLVVCQILSDSLNQLSQGRCLKQILLTSDRFVNNALFSVADRSLGSLIRASISLGLEIGVKNCELADDLHAYGLGLSRLIYLDLLLDVLENKGNAECDGQQNLLLHFSLTKSQADIYEFIHSVNLEERKRVFGALWKIKDSTVRLALTELIPNNRLPLALFELEEPELERNVA